MKLSFKYFIILTLVISVLSCQKEEINLDINELAAVWELDKFIDRNNNTLIAPEIQICFQEDNCITFFTPCLIGQGLFSIRGQNITVSNMKLNERCNTSPESYFFNSLMSMGNLLIMNLSGFYQINSDTLSIYSNNEYSLIFHKTQLTNPYQCDLTRLLIDTINISRYYSEDILDSNYSSIYGKWFLYFADGGWGEVVPNIDFIEFKKNGIYGISKGFELLEYGKIDVKNIISEKKVVIQLIPENNFNPLSITDQLLTFEGKDTIKISSCVGCYQSFSRIK